MDILGNPNGNVCTASDVNLAAALVGDDSVGAICFPGETFTADIEGNFTVRSNARWDIGIWIGQDGKAMNVNPVDGGATQCEVLPLPNTPKDSDNGPIGSPILGNFDGEDVCGDTNGNVNNDPASNVLLTFGNDPTAFNGPITLSCIAGPMGGVVLPSLVSWNQSNPGACDATDSSTYDLDNTSKCSVNSTEIAIDIVGRLTITKSAPTGPAEDFDFTWTNDSPPVDAMLNPSDPFTLSDGESEEIYGVIGDDGTAVITVTEQNLPMGWNLVDVQCTGDDVTAAVLNGNELTVTLSYDDVNPLDSQDDVFCTFINAEPSNTITVVKEVVGLAPGTDWDFTGTAPVNGFTLPAAGGFQSFMSLPNGMYTFTETTKPGYTASVDCTINGMSVATGSNEVTVSVSNDETATCTFTNTLDSANLRLQKQWIGGLAGDTSFLSIDGINNDTDTSTSTGGNQTDTTFTADIVAFVGETVNLAEILGMGNGAAYTTSFNCTGQTNDPAYTEGMATATLDIALADDGADIVCTFVNTITTGTFTVTKDFSDDNTDAVMVTLTCGGTTSIDSANPAAATEAAPAVFNLSGFGPGDTCTATEAVPVGYTGNDAACQAGGLLANGGTCEIVNTLNTSQFTVTKDFSDDNTDAVMVTLTCGGTTSIDSANPAAATEAAPAVFDVSGFGVADACTALEAVPVGYTGNVAACQAGGLLADGGTCEIVNTLNTAQFTVTKDFSDDNTDAVMVTLTCGGTTSIDSANPAAATEAAPAVFDVSGFGVADACTATEAVPVGYTGNDAACQAGGLLANGGTCEIVNTLNTAQFTVTKDFSDDSTDAVMVTLTCGGTTSIDSANPAAATEAAPAVFNVSGFGAADACTATEAVPMGYAGNDAACQVGGLLADGGTCEIVNTLNAAQFTVTKDFSDDNTDAVMVTLTCGGSTSIDSANPAAATEAAPAVFSVSKFGPADACTATEAVPVGYTGNDAACQVGGLLADGSGKPMAKG